MGALLCHDSENPPNLVLIGVPDLASLQRVAAKMTGLAIAHYRQNEPDGDLGFTALATAPITGDGRKVFQNYRTWNGECYKLSTKR